MKLDYLSEYSRRYYADYDADLEIRRPLQVESVEGGIVLPLREVWEGREVFYKGGVLDARREFVQLSATRRNSRSISVLGGYEVDKPPRRSHETVIYGGVLYAFYGHVLIETLARLWYYLLENPNRHRVVFDCVNDARGKFREFFDLLSIPYDDETFITEPVQYDQVVVPEQSFVYGVGWHRNWLVPFDFMMDKVEPGPFRRIMFSRLKLTRNPVFNEKAVCDVFRRAGYEIMYPERLSLREQIAALKGADSFVCWAGTLACQAVFCRSGCERIVLNRAFEPDAAHQMFDQARELKTTTVDCSLNPIPVSHVFGPWIVGITDEFRHFCLDRGFACPRSTNLVSIYNLLRFLVQWPSATGAVAGSIDRRELAISLSRVRLVRWPALRTRLKSFSRFLPSRLVRCLREIIHV